MRVIHSGIGGLVPVSFRPIAVAVRDSQDPPGPVNVSGRAYAASAIASPSGMKVYPRFRNRAMVSPSVRAFSSLQ